MRITLAEARQQLYPAIVPSLDNQANIDRFDSYLNLAQERLINSGKWNGGPTGDKKQATEAYWAKVKKHLK